MRFLIPLFALCTGHLGFAAPDDKPDKPSSAAELSEKGQSIYDTIMRMPKYPFTIHGHTVKGDYFKFSFDSYTGYQQKRGEEKARRAIQKGLGDVEEMTDRWCEANEHKDSWGKPGTAWFVFDLRALGNTKMTLTQFSQVKVSTKTVNAYAAPKEETKTSDSNRVTHSQIEKYAPKKDGEEASESLATTESDPDEAPESASEETAE